MTWSQRQRWIIEIKTNVCNNAICNEKPLHMCENDRATAEGRNVHARTKWCRLPFTTIHKNATSGRRNDDNEKNILLHHHLQMFVGSIWNTTTSMVTATATFLDKLFFRDFDHDDWNSILQFNERHWSKPKLLQYIYASLTYCRNQEK